MQAVHVSQIMQYCNHISKNRNILKFLVLLSTKPHYHFLSIVQYLFHWLHQHWQFSIVLSILQHKTSSTLTLLVF